jgi:hypothetical protein
MLNKTIKTQKETDYPVLVTNDTLSELATMLEAGELDVSDLSNDLVEAVINYQFNL